MHFKTETWIAWIAATLTAALTLSAFAFNSFELKEDARQKKEDLIKRLERIEDKIDRIKSAMN